MKDSYNIRTSNTRVGYGTLNKDTSELELDHCHQFYEILYVVRGVGKYIVEGSEYELIPGTLMLIPPLAYHHISLNSDTPYERFVIHFPKNDLLGNASHMLERMIGRDDTLGNYYHPSAISDSLVSPFYRFEAAMQLPDEERSEYVKTVLTELVILLSATTGERMMHTEDELGARIIRYLNQNIERNISLDKLAKRFFVSKYYLCRAFKKYNGISVHGYINQKRIAYAKQLIESGETASSASYKVGFGDYSAFYRAYVKIEGKSPTAD